MPQGYPGFQNSTIAVTIGGVYLGGGIAGWAGGTTFEFAVAVRNFPQVRPRQTTTDTGWEEGVGGPVSVDVRIRGYFKGADIPPDVFAGEYIYVQGIIGVKTLNAVILVENFNPTGDVTKAQEYEFNGKSDGIYEWA